MSAITFKVVAFSVIVLRTFALFCLLASLGRMTLYRHARSEDQQVKDHNLGWWYVGLGVLAILIASNLSV